MTETTDVAPPQSPATYQLVAADEGELRAAHGQMLKWVRDRQRACAAERDENAENLLIAKENGWRSSPFTKRISLLDRRIAFYEKIEGALKAGYVIVPNFQMTMFAIRTDATAPRGTETSDYSWNREPFEQTAKALPAGEGEYQNPLPVVVQTSEKVDDGKGGTKTEYTRWAEEFAALNFPVALAKPVLMTRTSEAMALKVFDEVGVAVDTVVRGGRKGDPIILGRIRNPRPDHPDMTFFIGWYFDPTNV